MSQILNPNLTRLQMVEQSVFNSASLTSSYVGLNLAANYVIYTGNGLQAPVKILEIKNKGSTAFTLSLDGVTDNRFVDIGETIKLDLQANHACNSSYSSGTLNAAKGQIIYGKGTAGTGNIYIFGYC